MEVFYSVIPSRFYCIMNACMYGCMMPVLWTNEPISLRARGLWKKDVMPLILFIASDRDLAFCRNVYTISPLLHHLVYTLLV